MADETNLIAADPLNYQVPGKVSLWFRPSGSVREQDWREFGNIADPAIAKEVETLDHYSQRRGLRAKDKSVEISRNARLNFVVDEINTDNILTAFGCGPVADATGSYLEGVTKTNPGADGEIDLGVAGLVEGSVVVRSIDQDNPVVYAEGYDYEVAEEYGVITIMPGGALDDANITQVRVQYRKEVTTRKAEIFDGTTIAGEARFQVLTPDGTQRIFTFLNVSIKNNGDLALGDGTDWEKMPLTMEVLVDDDGALGYVEVVKGTNLVP